MTIIRIQSEDFARLSKLKTSENEPVSRVIADLLNFAEAHSGRVQALRRTPVVRKALTPKAYEDTLRDVLMRHNRTAITEQIRPEVKAKMGHLFGPADLAKHTSGVPTWWNHAQLCWEGFKKRGEGHSPEQGVWALTAPTKRKAIAVADITWPELEDLIQRCLREAGGSARKQQVERWIEEPLGDRLTPYDWERLKNEIRWKKRVQFCRNYLREAGIIKAGSPKGVWELAD